METVEDGRKKVQSAQAVRDGERNSMEMGEQPKRICVGRHILLQKKCSLF